MQLFRLGFRKKSTNEINWAVDDTGREFLWNLRQAKQEAAVHTAALKLMGLDDVEVVIHDGEDFV